MFPPERFARVSAKDTMKRKQFVLKFSAAFEKFKTANNLSLTEAEVRNTDWETYGFSEYRPGKIKILDVFERPRFGISNAKKCIQQYGSLDAWLDSDPQLRNNYNLNCVLVLEEGIPGDIRSKILEAFNDAKTNVDIKKFEDFLEDNGIQRMSLALPNNFKRMFTVEDLF